MRGIRFLPVDLYKSDAVRLVTPEGIDLRLIRSRLGKRQRAILRQGKTGISYR